MPDNEDDPALDPNTPMGGAVAAGLLRRQADGSYIAYNSPMPEDTPAPPEVAAMAARLAALTTRDRRVRSYQRRDGSIGWSVEYRSGVVTIDNLAASPADAAFDAAAPADMAALLAEVERLRAALEHTTRFLATTQYLLDAAGQAQLALACYGARQELTHALQQP